MQIKMPVAITGYFLLSGLIIFFNKQKSVLPVLVLLLPNH